MTPCWNEITSIKDVSDECLNFLRKSRLFSDFCNRFYLNAKKIKQKCDHPPNPHFAECKNITESILKIKKSPKKVKATQTNKMPRDVQNLKNI